MDFEFVADIKGGNVPKEYIPGVQKGIESILGSGVVAGYPVLGMKATLVDGAYHDVDSSVMAFEIAGRAAAREGLRKAKARLMEPLMRVDITTPEEYMGDVLGDINSRRGLVGDLGERGNAKTIVATVPLANMFQYVSTLRSMSKGRANYSMKLAAYDFAEMKAADLHTQLDRERVANKLVSHDVAPCQKLASSVASSELIGAIPEDVQNLENNDHSRDLSCIRTLEKSQ